MLSAQKIEEYQGLFDSLNTIKVVVYSYNIQTKTICVPRTIVDIFGCTIEHFDRKFWTKLVHPDDRDDFIKWQQQVLEHKDSSFRRYRIICKNNEVRWIEDHLSPVYDLFEEVSEYIGILLDITEQIGMEKKFEYLAFHDALTGLQNRNIFNDYSLKALARSKRKNIEMGVLFLDVDRFKVINDTLGHEIGDTVLKLLAERLTHCVRDLDMVCRQGGDEFIILLEDTDRIKSEYAAQRILNKLKEPFHIGDEEVYITVSIGISMYPLHGDDIETLIRNADEAMYVAKEIGCNLYYFYQTDMQDKQIRKMRLDQALRKAIENNEMAIYYQPIIDLHTGNIVGMEALLRWMHPTLGLVQPLEFIPIAEQSGQIDYLGEWVLHQACAQNKQWQDVGFAPFKVIVNVSSYQLRNANFIKVVKEVIIKTGLDPSWLELDITEGFIQNIAEVMPVSHQLSELGVKISVDNFGTGVFSFEVFHRLPIEYLKIGKNLIQNIEDPITRTLVNAIIQMSKSLDLKLLAEGVENETHISFLTENDCGFGQGDYFCPPVPLDEINVMLESYYEWKSKYGGRVQNREKIKMMEEENKKLKQLLIDLSLRIG